MNKHIRNQIIWTIIIITMEIVLIIIDSRATVLYIILAIIAIINVGAITKKELKKEFKERIKEMKDIAK